MSWNVVEKSGLCYSNVSLIKRGLLHSKNGRLPYAEIVQYVNNYWNRIIALSGDEAKRLVAMDLFAPNSYFEEDENGFWGSKQTTDVLLNPIFEYVKNSRKPVHLNVLVSQIEPFHSEQDVNELLRSDIRFTELEGTSHWMLSEWELVNDEIFKYMNDEVIETAGRDEIYELILQKYDLDKEMTFFFPEIDQRFAIKNQHVQIELKNRQEKMEEIATSKVEILDNLDLFGNGERVKKNYHVVFDGNLPLTPKGDDNVSSNPEEAIVGAISKEVSPVLQTEVIQIGNITSGKKFILSFTDSKYKQIDKYPFLLRDGTETGSDKDEFYHYNHHWDLREGHDIEGISQEFPEIFAYEKRGQYGFEDITETQYTELIRYKVYGLIKKGQFVFTENENKKIYVIWDGNEVRPPVWYIPFELKGKEREIEEELEELVEIDEGIVIEDVDDVVSELIANESVIEDLNYISKTEVAAAASAVMEEVEVEVEVEEPVEEVVEQVEPPKEIGKIQAKFFEKKEAKPIPLPISNDLLFEEVRKMDRRIQTLEQKLNKLTEQNKKYRRNINLLIVLSIAIGAAGIYISLFM